MLKGLTARKRAVLEERKDPSVAGREKVRVEGPAGPCQEAGAFILWAVRLSLPPADWMTGSHSY